MKKLYQSSSSSSSKIHNKKKKQPLQEQEQEQEQRQLAALTKTWAPAKRQQQRRRYTENEFRKGDCSSSSDIEAPPNNKASLRFFLPHPPSSSSSSSSSPSSSSSSSLNYKTPTYINNNRIRVSAKHRPHKVQSFSVSTNPTTSPLTTCAIVRVRQSSPSTSKDHHSSKPPCLCHNHPNSVEIYPAPGSGDDDDDDESKLTSFVTKQGETASAPDFVLSSPPKRAIGLGSDPTSEETNTVNHILGTASVNSGDTRTPPIQASVSPEIMSSTSAAAAAAPTSSTLTAPCYVAAPMLSGVSDKRRRKPLGLLVVGEPKPLVDFDVSDDEGISVVDTGALALPLPLKASMHWFLSPCHEEDEDQGASTQHGFHFSHSSPASLSSSDSTHANLASHLGADSSSNTIGSATTGGITRPKWKQTSHVLPIEKDINFPDLDGRRSPVSIDSVGSANVMQTPQSDSASDTKIATNCLSDGDTRDKLIFEAKLNEVVEHLHGASLSPRTCVSLRNPASSSFQFDLSMTPPNSADISMFQKISDPQASLSSMSSMEIAQQSLTTISLMDGLVSSIFEMDKFDCCRCFSDEEDKSEGLNNDCSKSQFSPQLNHAFDQMANEFGSYEATDEECCIMCRKKDKFPPQAHCCCAESISIDGGGLICSDDSDWTSCYKNRLFQ